MQVEKWHVTPPHTQRQELRPLEEQLTCKGAHCTRVSAHVTRPRQHPRVNHRDPQWTRLAAGSGLYSLGR